MLVVFIQPRDKFLDARQQTVAVIDHTVHIADKTGSPSEFFHNSFSFPFIFLIIPQKCVLEKQFYVKFYKKCRPGWVCMFAVFV